MNLGKTLFYFLILTIIQAITFTIADLFDYAFGFGFLSVIIILYLISSFIFTYFYYPKVMRKKIFSDVNFYKDAGATFLILITIAVVRIYFGGSFSWV